MFRKMVLACTIPTLLALALLGHPALARESVEARLVEEGDSGVAGTALFTLAPPDTIGHVELNGLKPGSAARIVVHAGTCARRSASFVTLAEVAGDAKGKATGDGLLLFKGTESVEFTTVANGDHSVSVAQEDKVVACGPVPRRGTTAAAISEAGTEPPWNTYAAIATGVVVLAGAVLFFVQRVQRKKAKPAA